ncbi:hypothetical protein [Polycladomyces abyssicola]|nr:hypothetical protein [Polycladomyces abyssicola]
MKREANGLSRKASHEVDADGRRYLRGDGKVVELGDVLKQEIR